MVQHVVDLFLVEWTCSATSVIFRLDYHVAVRYVLLYYAVNHSQLDSYLRSDQHGPLVNLVFENHRAAHVTEP